VETAAMPVDVDAKDEMLRAVLDTPPQPAQEMRSEQSQE
jgi:hypothetical protein